MGRRSFVFAGSSHPVLAQKVSDCLQMPLGKIALGTFPDGETHVKVEEDVRGADVFILQSIAGHPNRFLLELLIIIDALKRDGAKSITPVIPYLGYCRQDRKDGPGTPITAKLVANLLVTAGATRLITVDLHADQVEGFFDIPVEHLHCQSLLAEAAKAALGDGELVVVAPDIGAVKIAEKTCKLLDAEMVVLSKERLSSYEVTATLIGHVRDKKVLIVDDLCSTGGTLVAAAELCLEKGASGVMAAITHAQFIDGALEKIAASDIERLFVTDTIAPSGPWPEKVAALSIAPLIAGAGDPSLEGSHPEFQ